MINWIYRKLLQATCLHDVINKGRGFWIYEDCQDGVVLCKCKEFGKVKKFRFGL